MDEEKSSSVIYFPKKYESECRSRREDLSPIIEQSHLLFDEKVKLIEDKNIRDCLSQLYINLLCRINSVLGSVNELNTQIGNLIERNNED